MVTCDCTDESLDGMAADAATRTVRSAIQRVVSKARRKHVAAALPDSLDPAESGRRFTSIILSRENVELPPDGEKMNREEAERLVRFVHSELGLSLIEAGRLV